MVVCVGFSNRSILKMSLEDGLLNFINTFARIHASTFNGIEEQQKLIKTTCAAAQKQVDDFKKTSRKGGARYKPTLPSVDENKEEKEEATEGGKNGRQRAAAMKSVEASRIMLGIIKPNKRGRPRKRKSSKSSQDMETTKIRKEETVVPLEDRVGLVKDDVEVRTNKSTLVNENNVEVQPAKCSNKQSKITKNDLMSPSVILSTSAMRNTLVKVNEEAVKNHSISPEKTIESAQKNKTIIISSKRNETIHEKSPETRRASLRKKSLPAALNVQAPSQVRSLQTSPSSTSGMCQKEEAYPDTKSVPASFQVRSSPRSTPTSGTCQKEEVKPDNKSEPASSQTCSSPIPTTSSTSSDKCQKEKDLTENRRVPDSPEGSASSEIPASSSDNEGNQSGSSDAPSIPEKRCTRSKMANLKKKNDVEEAKNQFLSSEELSSPEKRCTRSKMAKTKAVQDKVNGGRSGDDSSDEKSDSPRSQEEKTNARPKLNVKAIREMFTPGFKKDTEKENLLSYTSKTSEKKMVGKFTPLQIRNAYVTPVTKSSSKIPTLSSAVRSKIEEVERRKKEEEAKRKRQKEEEAIRKKKEMVKAKQEDVRRRNEEKMLKAAATREAAEKEKSEHLIRMEKEKEEREKAVKEMLERKKEEEVIKKKKAHQTKAMEAETRRLKEEAARLAKIKEMEEEQRQQEELRLKQQEEMERIQKQRQEELRMKEAAMKEREQQKKKPNLIPLKDKDNLDINDIELEDDDDDDYQESTTKKEIPMWARKSEEKYRQDRIQALVPMDVIREYYACPSQSPDLTELFGKMTLKRVRSSSAVWLDTPPLQYKK